MWERGDLVTPTLGGRTWFEKPALLYWFMMAGYAVFGVSEWAARFGSACSGLLTVLFVGMLARRVEHAGATGEMRGFALASVAVTGTTAGIILFAHGASFDIVVTMTITAALASFLASEIEGDARKRHWLLAGFYAGMGVSLIAKGLIGIILPCGVVALYYLLRRERPRLLRRGVGWGALVTLAGASLWYAPVIARHGWHFVDEFFVQHHFARFTSNKYQHWQPFYFYLYMLPLLALPWTAFLASALARLVKQRAGWGDDDAGARVRVFALAWLVVPVAFFSISGSKLPGYILPAVPGAALLAAQGLMRYARGENGVGEMRATGIMLVLLAAAGAFFMHRFEGVAALSALMVSVAALTAGAFALVMSRRRLMSAVSVVLMACLTVILTATLALDAGARTRSVRDLLRAARAVRQRLRAIRSGPRFAAPNGPDS
jgi:4-amino-4-deoxy-L-arabinose transferase-like glycosyltransferase